MEVRFEVYSITFNYIYKLKLGLGTFGKDYGSVLNVDQKDFFFSIIIRSLGYKDSNSGYWKRSLKN